MPLQNLTIDIDRVTRELEELANFSDAPAPAVTRILFTPRDMEARQFLTASCEATGLTVRTDAAGNIFARWTGSEPDLSAVATGSHCDAIPHSGRYDGTVGVWGGLESIRALQSSGFQPRRSIDLIMFTAEEPTRYGIGCIGSRLLAATLDSNVADAFTDDADATFKQTRIEHGLTASLDTVALSNNAYHGFVELHIEQGPLLEEQGIEIGIVTAIAAPAAIRIDYEGAGGHAGAVLMKQRRDALLPAAELALAVKAAADELGGEDTVATTGVLDVFPRAINSIPARSHLEIDIRDTQLARRDEVLQRVLDQAKSIGEKHDQTTTSEIISKDPPVQCDSSVVAAIQSACNDASVTHQEMISRAYHDSLFMAQICPTAMIFIPCKDGISHRPDEYSSPADIARGIEVLARSLASLAQ